jgi:CubicO group peptidase (beta-lactamase class C family)
MEHGFRKYTRLLAAFLVLPMIACAQGDFDTAAIDNVFADFNSQTPGCALGIVQSGQLVYGRGYGMANLEHDIPINTTSVFRIGSVSKQFAAAVAALAAMEGYLDLEDQLQKWIPELPDYGEPLTLRHTLNHTSGLRDYITLMSLKRFRGDDFYTVADLIEVQALQEELNFSSGSEYLYSNSGYVLATEAVARAVGKPFKDYAEEVLFRPLQMSHSHFHDDHNHIVPLRADGYSPRGDSFRTNMTTLDMIGDGGVYTSIDDMVHWVTALEQDGIRPGLTPILETRGVLNSGEEISYALGQSHGEHRGLATIGHGGSWVGFRADVLRFPSQSTSIVTLCNRSDASPSGRAIQVADVVLAEHLAPVSEEPSLEAEDRRARAEPSEISDPSPYLGTYYSPELDVNYEFTNTDGSLVVHLGSNAESELQRISGDTLVAGNWTFRFSREGSEVTGFELDAGRVVHLRFRRLN